MRACAFNSKQAAEACAEIAWLIVGHMFVHAAKPNRTFYPFSFPAQQHASLSCCLHGLQQPKRHL